MESSINQDEYNKIALIYLSVELDVKNVLPMIEHILEIRKRYAEIFTRTDEFEPQHQESLNGFNFCNGEIKKLLGII